jgi:TonB family protein
MGIGDLLMILRWVKRSAVFGLLLAPFAGLPSWSQSNHIQDQVRSAYKGKIFLIRNFYAGNELQYDENGLLKGNATPGPWSLAGVEIKDIDATAQEVDITGNRLGTLYRNGKPGFVKVGKLHIHLAKGISDGDKEADIEAILGKVFMQLGENLRPLVPECWTYYFSGNDLQSRSRAWKAAVESKYPTFKPNDVGSPGVTAPRPIQTPDPKYTKEAVSNHVEGVSRIGIVVDATGVVSDAIILDPLGMGLDEQAVLATKQWRFRPALKNGEGVRVQINVDMNFRCCP